MSRSKQYEDYTKEKIEREWKKKVTEEKAKLGNAERIEKAARYKGLGNDKFKAGNKLEAIEYYREAVEYIHDMVNARRVERSALLVPLHLNLARCYGNDHEKVREHATKAIEEAEVPKNDVAPAFLAKALVRRAEALIHCKSFQDAKTDLQHALKVSQQFHDEATRLLKESVDPHLLAEKQKRAQYAGFFQKKNPKYPGEHAKNEKEDDKTNGVNGAVSPHEVVVEQHEGIDRIDRANLFAQSAMRGLDGKLYEDVDRAMEPAREKERNTRRQLELEKDLHAIIDEDQNRGEKKKSGGKSDEQTSFDQFLEARKARFNEQEDELDQKKKVLDKLEREKQWDEDERWAEYQAGVKERRCHNGLTCDNIDGWKEKKMLRWATMRMRELTIALFFQPEENMDCKLVSQLTGDPEDQCGGRGMRALITDCRFGDERQDAAIIQRPGQKPLHYWDFELTFDWEVTVCKRGETSYREAKELIREAADREHHSAPPSVTKNYIIQGFYSILNFASDEMGMLDEEEYELKCEVTKRYGYGAKVERHAEESQKQLEERLKKQLITWVKNFTAKT